MDYYNSFNRPRREGWLSWPCWLTDSGRLTHKVVTRPAFSLAQDSESSPARTGVLTTILRHHYAEAAEDNELLEKVQRRFIRIFTELKGKDYHEIFRHLNLWTLEERSIDY